jgi:hypothetical protein
MMDKTTSQQKQRTDKMEALLRDHAGKRTSWKEVLNVVKSEFSDSDVACLIDRIQPTAHNLRIIYEGMITDRY